jgi:hypothetical protein
MAETADNVAQRYAVLEQAYSREDWATVLRDGQDLLGKLRQANDPRMLGLQMRLQLLLGHTQLYGFGDKAAAAGFYGAVATQSAEAALATIAEQGLKQCNEVEAAATEPAAEPKPTAETTAEPEPAAEPSAAASGPATPTPSEPTVAPEPQAAVAAAAQTPFTTPAPAEVTTPASLTFDAGSSPPPGGGTSTPATPWLTTGTPAAEGTGAMASTPPESAPTTGTAPTAGALGVDAAAAAPWIEAPLIPEVVEEPELIEVHQADPSLAEDLELTWDETAPTPREAPLSSADEGLSQEDEELLSGLLLVRLG